jgi:transcriptional regulator with XRE-family HTH domain
MSDTQSIVTYPAVPPISLGARIRLARLNAGFPRQADLASAIGVQANAVSRWEADVFTPDFAHVLKVAALCAVPLAWLAEVVPGAPDISMVVWLPSLPTSR